MDFLKIINISLYWFYFSNSFWIDYWHLFGHQITHDIYNILIRRFPDLVNQS
jgi:hypothetical protein